MGKNELSEAGTSMVRDNMANFRRDTRKTRVTGYPGDKACSPVSPLRVRFRCRLYHFCVESCTYCKHKRQRIRALN